MKIERLPVLPFQIIGSLSKGRIFPWTRGFRGSAEPILGFTEKRRLLKLGSTQMGST